MQSEPRVQWVTAAPFWSELGQTGLANPPLNEQQRKTRFRQPALLRFATDTFMDDLNTLLASAPAQVAALRAKPETWRGHEPALPVALPSGQMQRAVALRKTRGLHSPRQALAALKALPVPAQQTIATPSTLKLYQPAHQRYYLVTACLVCRVPGLPDRVINIGENERATFVLRRIKPNGEEYALVDQAGQRGWQWVEDAHGIAEGEEQLPLFPLNYDAEDGRRRRLLGGLVPVSRREALVHARPLTKDLPTKDPREAQLEARVIAPWVALVDQAERVYNALNPDLIKDPEAKVKVKASESLLTNTRNDIQHSSWLVLLDFATFLETYVNEVWLVVKGELSDATLTPAQLASLTALRQIKTKTSAFSLADALKQIVSFKANLEANANAYGTPPSDDVWPDFKLQLADPNPGIAPMPSCIVIPGAGTFKEQRDYLNKTLFDLIKAAWPKEIPAGTPPVPLVMQPLMDVNEPAWFVIRMVFERPQCSPSQRITLSPPTERFQLASFFDPDAPARPLRIALPIDTSPAGLRRHDKNTAFMISDILCGQVTKARSLGLGDLVRAVLPWPFHKDLDLSADWGPCKDDKEAAMGMMCSLSIPIITICAFILLMVMVTLLDLIFHWMPFFILCFPIPKFVAKKLEGI